MDVGEKHSVGIHTMFKGGPRAHGQRLDAWVIAPTPPSPLSSPGATARGRAG